jgi:hypothetical protein
MIGKIFGGLPEGILDSIFEFANDGPLRLAFDAKKKSFVNKINNNFMRLKKALEFKIENPPEWDRDDPWDGGDGEEEEEIDLTDIGEDITEMLTFKYPLKLRLRQGCEDDFHRDNGYLSVTFYYRKDFYSEITKNCKISIPEYYISLRSKAYNHYKKQMNKNLSKKQMYRVRNLVNGFSTRSYEEI